VSATHFVIGVGTVVRCFARGRNVVSKHSIVSPAWFTMKAS
jgi:hypothetical protein